MKRLAIFASGSGTNAENIAKYFSQNNQVEISLILTNNEKAGVIERAKKFNIQHFVFSRDDFYKTDLVINQLEKHNINFIVLAGFLWLVPKNLIAKWPDRIVNIHPALLPKYGGKGMYGMNVHKAVKEAGEKESGISIHFVNEKYDEGSIIVQKKVEILSTDSPEDIATKVHQLEYQHYPQAIEMMLAELP